jgi:hypothetical protein
VSLSDDLDRLAEKRDKAILFVDIECSPITAHVWDVWGKVGGPSKVVEPQRVMCLAAKWHGRGEVHFASEYHHGREAMIRTAWHLIDRADIVVGYNHIRYDIPHLRREFLMAGIPPARPHKDVDLYRAVKRFKWESNSLAYVSQRLGLGGKAPHSGLDTWRRCMAGDAEAWAEFKRYNVQDVRLTERLYERLLPHIPTHPHVSNAGEVLSCNRCGGTDLDDAGSWTAAVHSYGMYRCATCGGYVRAGFLKRVATTRGVG